MAFLIVGNSSSGTSFCSYVMDMHPDIHCPFEEFYPAHYAETVELWRQRRDMDGLYGTKVPIEEVILRFTDRWTEDELIALVDEFDIIYNWRAFEPWLASWNDRQSPKLDEAQGRAWWETGWRIANAMMQRRPEGVIFNNYEALKADLEPCAARLYRFVGVTPVAPDPSVVRSSAR